MTPAHLNISRRSFWIGLAIFILPFIVFLPETLGLRAWFEYDLQCYFYPYRKAAVDIVRSGHLPLWNPYVNAGMPMLGDGQVALFYPPNWLMYFINPAHALMLAVISTFAIAGVGMFAYLRELRFDRLIASIAAVSFMFSGFFVAHLSHVSIPATAALVPLIFWAFERLIRRRSIGALIVGATVFAMQIFAGHPQIPIYCALAIGIYALVIAGYDFDFKPIALLAGMYLLGAMLAAIQLIPWFELMQFSPRYHATTYELFRSNSIVGADWLLMLFPYAAGGFQTSWMQSLGNVEYGQLLHMWERMSYVGALTLGLAVVGLFELHRRDTDESQIRLRAIVIVLVAMLLIAAGGTTPVGRLIHAAPILGQLRAPARATAITAFALNVLLAFGMKRQRVRRIDFVPIVIAVAISATILAAIAFTHVANAIVPASFTVFAAIILCALAFGWTNRKRVIAGIAIGIELLCFATTFNRTVRADEFAGVPPSVEFLRRDLEPFRVGVMFSSAKVSPVLAKDQLVVNWAAAFGIEDINGFNSLQPRRLVQLLLNKDSDDVTYGALFPQRLQAGYDKPLRLLDAKYVLLQQDCGVEPPPDWRVVYADNAVRIMLNPAPVRRAFFADHIVHADDEQSALKILHYSDFDALNSAVTESPVTVEAGAGGKFERINCSVNEQTWRTRVDRPRLLVISETWFPGWVAEYRRAGSQDAWIRSPIFRTNYLLRSVVAPTGDNEIHFAYRPASALAGAIITAMTIIGMIIAMAIAWHVGAR